MKWQKWQNIDNISELSLFQSFFRHLGTFLDAYAVYLCSGNFTLFSVRRIFMYSINMQL